MLLASISIKLYSNNMQQLQNNLQTVKSPMRLKESFKVPQRCSETAVQQTWNYLRAKSASSLIQHKLKLQRLSSGTENVPDSPPAPSLYRPEMSRLADFKRCDKVLCNASLQQRNKMCLVRVSFFFFSLSQSINT